MGALEKHHTQCVWKWMYNCHIVSCAMRASNLATLISCDNWATTTPINVHMGTVKMTKNMQQWGTLTLKKKQKQC